MLISWVTDKIMHRINNDPTVKHPLNRQKAQNSNIIMILLQSYDFGTSSQAMTDYSYVRARRQWYNLFSAIFLPPGTSTWHIVGTQ